MPVQGRSNSSQEQSTPPNQERTSVVLYTPVHPGPLLGCHETKVVSRHFDLTVPGPFTFRVLEVPKTNGVSFFFFTSLFGPLLTFYWEVQEGRDHQRQDSEGLGYSHSSSHVRKPLPRRTSPEDPQSSRRSASCLDEVR